jgi:hypothetical protein
VTLGQVQTDQVWHLGAPVFIALILGAAIGGWILGWLLEQWAGLPAAWTRLSVRAILVVAFAAVVAVSVLYLARHSGSLRIDAIRLGVTAGTAFAGGATARFWFGSRAVVSQLVIAAAVAFWGYYDAVSVFHRPFRDLKLYLDAGGAWLHGRAVYLAAPLTVVPSDPARLPFVYPPFLLPFFGALSRLPQGVAIVLWEILALGAVIVAFKLFGVRSRWIPLLILWPPIAIGLSVGNAAPFGFLGLAAGWRWGPALVLGGVFKAQAAIPALWLLRERRWRPFVLGCTVIAALALVTLPLTGLAIYLDWLRSLPVFEETVRRFPGMEGVALQAYLPQGLAIAIAVVAAAAAMLASGRMGLSRFGIVAIVASPTVYVHGLALLLPAVLWLDATSLWLILGLVCTEWLWLAIAVTGAALLFGLTRGAIATRWARVAAPESAGRDSSLHLLDRGSEPWPDPGA